jgi:hypothetical protein
MEPPSRPYILLISTEDYTAFLRVPAKTTTPTGHGNPCHVARRSSGVGAIAYPRFRLIPRQSAGMLCIPRCAPSSCLLVHMTFLVHFLVPMEDVASGSALVIGFCHSKALPTVTKSWTHGLGSTSAMVLLMGTFVCALSCPARSSRTGN